MKFEKHVTLAGSQRTPAFEAHEIGAVQPSEHVQVTVTLRRKDAGAGEGSDGFAKNRVPHHEFASRFGADPQDIELVESYAHESGLTVVESNAAKRRVILAGSVDAVAAAFGAKVACYKIDTTGPTYRGRTGELTVPEELKGVVVAVLGLDNRPAAKPHIRRIVAHATAGTFTPGQVAELYNFPKGATGAGQTVAIVELGGGYSTADLKAYFKELGIKEPKITAVSVDGGRNTPGSDADGEVMLDIQVVGAIASGANIAVYFAPNTDQGFVDAITDAVHDAARKPSVVSISWGSAEDNWTPQAQTAMNAALQDAAALGVTVTVASGDNGSSDGATDGKLHVDFPASSPYALACGGTKLTGSGSKISSEVVWNETASNEGATGGGVSTVFALPDYQASAGVPLQHQTNFKGRGVPDVSGDADPITGYRIRIHGQDTVIGGTSAVAPLWAALVAMLNQQLGAHVGFLNPKLYPIGESAFHDITSGNNDDSNLGAYSARAGWDPCTGLGSPNGAALLSALQTSSVTSTGTHSTSDTTSGGTEVASGTLAAVSGQK